MLLNRQLSLSLQKKDWNFIAEFQAGCIRQVRNCPQVGVTWRVSGVKVVQKGCKMVRIRQKLSEWMLTEVSRFFEKALFSGT